MRRFGEPLVEHFGYQKLETVGYSLVQLIETSPIVGHFSGFKRAASLDVFSCREYADVFLTTDDRLLRLSARMSEGLCIPVRNPLPWLEEVTKR